MTQKNNPVLYSEYHTITKITTVLFCDTYFLFKSVQHYWSIKARVYICTAVPSDYLVINGRQLHTEFDFLNWGFKKQWNGSLYCSPPFLVLQLMMESNGFTDLLLELLLRICVATLFLLMHYSWHRCSLLAWRLVLYCNENNVHKLKNGQASL